MVSGPEPGKASEAGCSSNDEGRSTAPSARSDGLDNVDGGPDRRVYSQMGGIEQVRILGRLQRGHRAGHIALIALADVGEHGGRVGRLARAPATPAAGGAPVPLLWR